MTEQVSTVLRIDRKTLDTIKDMAAKENRSMNGQIVHILQETADMIKHQYKKRSKGQIK